MAIYYAIVDGDPLTSGPNSLVYAPNTSCFIDDESGRQRNMAFIGDKAYCEKCNSTGIIIGGARVDNDHRMIDLEDGRRQAVGGDYVLCQCPERPQVIARYGRNWMIEDDGGSQTPSKAAAPATVADHWIAFRLDERGSCEGLLCVAHFRDGSKEYGTFDANNKVRFERADNENACAHIELLPSDGAGASGSVTESNLSSIAG